MGGTQGLLLPLDLGGRRGRDPTTPTPTPTPTLTLTPTPHCSPTRWATASVVLTSGGQSGDCRGRAGRCDLAVQKPQWLFPLLSRRGVHFTELRGVYLAFPAS